jgi:hypothetical protein
VGVVTLLNRDPEQEEEPPSAGVVTLLNRDPEQEEEPPSAGVVTLLNRDPEQEETQKFICSPFIFSTKAQNDINTQR